MTAPGLPPEIRDPPGPGSYPRAGARPGIMDWWSGDTLSLIMLVAFVILAIWLTRRG